jgi:hypothetical protein
MRLDVILSVFLCLLLTSCGVFNAAKEKSLIALGMGPNKLNSVGISVLEREERRAVAIEIVFVYSEGAAQLIKSVDAVRWFAEHDGYCTNFGEEIDVERLELPKGYVFQYSNLPKDHSKAILIVAFIQGIGKVDLSQLENPWIELVGDEIVTRTEPTIGVFTDYQRSNQSSGVTSC